MTREEAQQSLLAWFRQTIKDEEEQVKRLESIGFANQTEYLRKSIESRKEAMKRFAEFL